MSSIICKTEADFRNNRLLNALKSGYGKTLYGVLADSTCDEFIDIAKNKMVFLWGCGDGFFFFQRRFWKLVEIKGVIDSNESKWGAVWEEEYGEFGHKDSYYEKIISPSILRQFDKEEVVVLIMSFKYHDEIYQELTSQGFQYIYSLINILSNEEEAVLEELADYRDLYKNEINHTQVLVNIGVHGAHGKAISDALLRMYPDVEIIWIVRKRIEDVSNRIKQVYETNLMGYIRAVATSHVLIYDTVIFPYATIKKEGQIFIQAKHWSSITLKRFGFEEPGGVGIPEKTLARDMTDYILTGSEFDEKSCKTGLGDITCVFVGSPRSDVLFDSSVRKKIYCENNIDDDVNTILYAPTFRVDSMGRAICQKTTLDYKRIVQSFEDRFGGRWVLLLRFHPLIEECLCDLDESVINVSLYSDSQELVAASDAMISDYSSIMFEPMFVKKPVFLFAPDKESYVNKEMPLILDYEKLPFVNVQTNEELAQVILNFDEKEYLNRINSFMKKHGVHEDGHASERAARFVWKCIQEA